MMRNKPFLASLCLAAVCLLNSGAAIAPPAKADVVEVAFKDLNFNPETVTIKVGQTIKWTNKDNRDCSIMAKDRSFQSGNLRPKESFEHKFTSAGTFEYLDILHPRVSGTVVVEAKK